VIKVSWSGRKRCYDNILVERLWRTVKYEEVYLHAYSDGWEAENSLAPFLWRYCHVRPHSSLGGRTPHEVYTEIEPCSSRPELTMSGVRTVQLKAPILLVRMCPSGIELRKLIGSKSIAAGPVSGTGSE